ncbi:uncharacterized protein LOC131023525 [Salvia miltiorrhiza]|uniref:uncharacterized protein LOC131023525 n=1 Tax=Salvia miltiorrhiza TaxID=226208 RepID=UPI0025AD8367|nr:uncharacterized protein LOC131023525 [Salvia miltiorrhiza]
MEFVRYIYVRYNGVVDGIHYVGGATEVLPLLNETVASLIYSINNVLTTHSLSPNYQLYYLATNRFGRETKCVISDDDDVQGLLETAEYPMVYVEHNNDPVEEAYIPTFDFGQASGYGDDEAQSSQYETSYHARESAPPTQYFSWDGQPLDESAWNLNEMCGRFNQGLRQKLYAQIRDASITSASTLISASSMCVHLVTAEGCGECISLKSTLAKGSWAF